MNRDTVSEAMQWRENLRPDSPLVDFLTNATAATLTQAYLLWWSTYSAGIRNSPTARRPEGVSASDAKKAAQDANDAVLGIDKP